MENIKTVADVQQNKPKKKFCFAIIPLIVYGLAFVSLSLNIYTSSDYSWGRDRTWLLFFITLFIHLVSIVLLIIFISKRTTSPVLSIPFFGLAFTNILTCFDCIGEMFDNYEDFLPYFNKENIDFFIERDGHTEYFFQTFELYKHFLINSAIDFVLSFSLVVTFLIVAAYVILAVIKKDIKIIRIFSFVPALIGVVPGIVWTIHIFEELYYGIKLPSYPPFDPMYHIIKGSAIAIGVTLPLIIFLFMFCFWVSKPYKKVSKEYIKESIPQEISPVPPATAVKTEPAFAVTPSVNPVAAVKPQPVANPAPVNRAPVAPVQADADLQERNLRLLKQCKELLDMGAITQEEYDEKKNELLGL